jgi:hypothetical protein
MVWSSITKLFLIDMRTRHSVGSRTMVDAQQDRYISVLHGKYTAMYMVRLTCELCVSFRSLRAGVLGFDWWRAWRGETWAHSEIRD